MSSGCGIGIVYTPYTDNAGCLLANGIESVLYVCLSVMHYPLLSLSSALVVLVLN